MNLNKQLDHLAYVRREDANKIFTMYLSTDPSDPDQRGGKWKINFKKGMRNFESYLREDSNKEELKNFQLVRQKVEKFVYGHEPDMLKGVIVFATADEEIWFADRFQMPMESTFAWQETPDLDQIKYLKEHYPKSGIILVQQNEIKVIESDLNRIEETTSFELDLNTDDWRQMRKPRKGRTTVGAPGVANYQQDKIEARYEENKHRWYKKIAPRIDKRAKEHHWEKIFVVGEADPAMQLKIEMNRHVNGIIQKNMLDHEESNILREVFG
jgi:hypothetical protein